MHLRGLSRGLRIVGAFALPGAVAACGGLLGVDFDDARPVANPASNDGGSAEPAPAEASAPDAAHAPDAPALLHAIAVSAGGLHACALLSDRTVRCWGQNDKGELGNGLKAGSQSAVTVSGLANVESLLAADQHSCAVTTKGDLFCWGNNVSGQLGTGDTADRAVPAPVVGLSSAVASVSADYDHTCALLRSGGVECWGKNDHGALGDGSTTASSRPVPVLGLSSGVVALSAGYGRTCALLAGGVIKCWGLNESGQLGDGTKIDRTSPLSVADVASGAVTISVGWLHVCALLSNGAVECHGYNGWGQLGDSTNTDRWSWSERKLVTGLDSSSSSAFASLYHSCAVRAGAVYCWGGDQWGQLGDGSKNNQSTPRIVSGLGAGMVAVSPGIGFSCALSAAGAVQCWGSNSDGQLGATSSETCEAGVPCSTTPLTVQGLP
jgi:alpha-tubulin suppressor-like RCC1 family protein